MKFRAYYKGDLDLGTPLKFEQMEVDDELYFVHDHIRYPFAIPFQDDDWIVNMYTGINDSDGVEIYEGDLCAPSKDRSYEHLKAPVEFRKGCFWYFRKPLYEQFSIYVVGNIYDNKLPT